MAEQWTAPPVQTPVRLKKVLGKHLITNTDGSKILAEVTDLAFANWLVTSVNRLASCMNAVPEGFTREDLITDARLTYGNDDVEIDDDALMSEVDEDGTWVGAWVYVRHEDIDRQGWFIQDEALCFGWCCKCGFYNSETFLPQEEWPDNKALPCTDCNKKSDKVPPPPAELLATLERGTP